MKNVLTDKSSQPSPEACLNASRSTDAIRLSCKNNSYKLDAFDNDIELTVVMSFSVK